MGKSSGGPTANNTITATDALSCQLNAQHKAPFTHTSSRRTYAAATLKNILKVAQKCRFL